MAIGIRQSDVAESSTHCREKEHFSRPSKQVQGPTNRVDVEQKDSPKAAHNLGSSSHRSVCISNKSSNTDLLLMESRPSSLYNRCFNNSMEQHVCLCISSNMSHSQDSATHDTIQLSTDSYCPTLAKETLVPQSPKINSRLSEKASSQRRSSTSAKIKYSSSKSSSIKSNYMALIDKHFKEKGFSKQTRKLLQASWRKGAQKDYSCKFRKFNSWCSRREVNPYNASLIDAAEFLTELFSEDLQYRNIAGYRSMLSSVMSPIEKFPVGQHPYIIRLIKGVFNSRPPKVILLPEWDLPLV